MSYISDINNCENNKSNSEIIPLENNHSVMSEQLAVETQGITYGYETKRTILKSVNINVNKGSIYGLLGPSGCGKTTLLKCLIGRLKPKEGIIRIYGKCPGDPNLCIPGKGIGYMPQELALYPEITVKEILIYFGSLYFMTKRQLSERMHFLLNFLEIPNKNSLIKNLSGGQTRRVSFACALIHQPPLLILDEPTVGVDPLLRHSIWQHLNEMATKNHMTIIITTHYVEEARKANTVALMRNGTLLTEMNPEILMQRHEAQTLEDVFWKLCSKDNRSKETKIGNGVACANGFKSVAILDEQPKKYEELRLMKHGVTANSNTKENDFVSPLLSSDFNKNDEIMYHRPQSSIALRESIIRMTALIMKSFICLWRNKLFSIFQVIVPAFQIVFFCICIGQEPFDLGIGVVNNETNMFGYSEEFLGAINNKTIRQVPYDNLSLALDSVKRGETWGTVFIGPRFSGALRDRLLEGNNVENQTIHDSIIKLHLDFTNQQIALTIYVRIIEAFQRFARKMLVNVNENTYLAESPISIGNAVYGSAEPNFIEFIGPGIILTMTQLFAMGLTVLSIIMEKKEGLLDRCWVAGVSAGEMICAIMSVLFITMIAQIALIMIATIYVLQLPVIGSYFWLFVCVLLSGTTGMTYGLFLSTLCSTEVVAVFMTLGSYYPMFLFSGMIWPVEGMPHYLRYISYCMPLTCLGDTLRSVMLRGWSITENFAWVGIAIPLAWTTCLLIASCIILKFRMSK